MNLTTLRLYYFVPTVLRFGRVRVMIYTNDHPLAHVHVLEGPRQAVFELNCPSGPIELRENYGFTWPQVNRLARLLQSHLQLLCAAWSEIHGDL
jgi:Domain of unknown function (DUF4160)